MIDTIILRIHNLKKYAATVNILHAKKKGAITRIQVDKETGEYLGSSQNTNMHAVLYHNSNYIDFSNHSSTITLPSSHYSISYFINFKADFIEFNFSIPKYRFGSNLFQFIDYFSQTAEKQYRILMDFIQRFKGNFVDPIDDKDLEINRLDFCYNQFFPTKEAALSYKEVQEKAFIKKTRSAKGFKQYGSETLMLVTNRYSFKVYHKGSEFRKKDYLELQKQNYRGYDLQKMVDIADRTLRYECSFRSSYIFYQWQQIYVLAGQKKRIKNNVYSYLFRVCKIQANVNSGARSKKANIEAKKFFIKSRFDNWQQYKKRDGFRWIENFIHDHSVTFTYDLFNSLYVEFWKHIKSVQIKTSANISSPIIQKRIKQYDREENIKCELRSKPAAKKNEGRLLMYFSISQKGSLKKYMERGNISRSTYQKVMVVFKRIGLGDYNPAVNLSTPSLGYQDYKTYFGNFVN